MYCNSVVKRESKGPKAVIQNGAAGGLGFCLEHELQPELRLSRELGKGTRDVAEAGHWWIVAHAQLSYG